MGKVLGFARLIKDVNVYNETQTQLPLDSETQTESVAEKPLTFIKIEPTEGIENYKCEFTRTKNFKDLDAYFGATRVEKIDIHERFSAFKDKKSEYIFFDTNTKNASSFVRRINKKFLDSSKRKAANSNEGSSKSTKPDPVFEEVVIDFEKIMTKSENILSAWVNINAANITSKSLHGIAIDETTDFEELLKEGTISSLTIEYKFTDKVSVKILISKKGSLYLLDNIAPESKIQANEILVRFFNEFILS